jgi:Hint domain/Bacterial Ig domain
MATGAELTYNTNATALQMADAIFGNGVTVVGASYTGDNRSSATYANGNALAPGVVPGDTGVILSTGQATSFTQSNGDPNRSTQTSTDTSGVNGNAQLNALAGATTYDAAILDVDFIPTGNMLTMKFVFSSEEFPEYSSSQFNDVFGVWINGSLVPFEAGNGVVGVNNLASAASSNLLVSNTNDAYNTEMDGFTLTLSLNIPVIAGVVNSIRIGIADVVDARYDSNLLIAGNSGQSTLVAIRDRETQYINQTKTIDVLGNDVNINGGALTITHINGIAVTAGQIVTLPSGDQVRLNADGTLTIINDADADKWSFTYTVQNTAGDTAIGIVTIDTIPCFVAGTLIRTPEGEVPVERLDVGDLVETMDHGPQEVRWVGRRIVAAREKLAPVLIEAGAFGPHGTLMVSPQHRILVRNSHAELLFGETEVLIAAKDLVNGGSVRVMEGGWVEYVHLLFDRHEVVFSQGLATESFLPGPQTARSFDREIVEEILTIFPEIDLATGDGYSPAARRTLKAHEAKVLVASGLAA